MSVPVLELRGAVRAYGSLQALDGVDLTIAPGERVALLGPNGAGKTTLIRAIAGLGMLDGGDIRLGGAAATRESRRTLGLVPQSLAVHDLLTGAENLQLVGRLHGLRGSALRTRVTDVLEWTGLTPRKDDLTGTYSGGMKRRLNIGCGVLHEPDLLLLDEPTVGVDPQSRARISDMLAELNASGTAFLLTTHMMEEAAAHMDRVVIIDHGTIIANDTLEVLLEAHFGGTRTLRVTPATDPPPPGWTLQGGTMCRDLSGGDGIASWMRELEQQGADIQGIRIDTPTLQDVFLHLTGRELRE